MLSDKAGLLLLYLTLVLGVCAWPFVLRLAPWSAHPRPAPHALAGLLGLGAVAVLMSRGMPTPTSPLILSLAFILPLLGQGTAVVVGALAALPLLATVTWWAPAIELPAWRAVPFVLLGLGATSLPHLWRAGPGLPSRAGLLASIAVGAAAVLMTGIHSTPNAFLALWHHWGAYVAPAEALLGGGVPFRDFPVQYGMGPTLLIAALCQGDCFRATYWVVAAANLLYLLMLGACVLLLTRTASRGMAVLALAAITCAAVLWTAYPPDFLGAVATPSVGGLRFLPLVLLVFHVLSREAEGTPADGCGHALWCLALAWSPEAGFQATLVWWPYLALRRAAGVTAAGPLIRIVVTGALRAVLALLVAVCVLALVFRLSFGDWPSVQGFLTYVRNPPGVLQVNPLGPVWLALAALAVSWLAMAWSDAAAQRVAFVGLAAFLAVSSYYLGRSHDNNLLNLFPFMVLALLSAIRAESPAVLRGFAHMTLAGLVAWTATFGLDSWSQARQEGVAGLVGPAALLDQMRLSSPISFALMDRALSRPDGAAAPFSDLGEALAELRLLGAGSPLVVNASRTSVRGMTGPTWTGMQNLATYELLPPATIEHFIRRGAQVYRQPGWILIDRTHGNTSLERFAVAYDVVEERVFGGYTAYRLVPR
jgi:hypothetical protein